jgi:hypothetical protein
VIGSAVASALRGLLAQVDPPSAGTSAPLEEGLLSIVLWVGEQAEPDAVDETLFSIACQGHRPTELVLAGAGAARAAPSAARYERLGGFTHRVAPADADALPARGQYAAFLSPGWLVYPDHYPALIEALRTSDRAWALARARSCRIDGGDIQAKTPFPLGEEVDVRQLLAHPDLACALVVDRTRIGSFALPWRPEELGALPIRLGAAFRPRFLGGLASCERRGPAEGAQPPPRGPEVLVQLDDLLAWLDRARGEGEAAQGLRHRFMDDLNAGLKERAPRLHSALKALARRIARGP